MLHRAAPLFLLACLGCGTPDRWHVSSAYGQSEYTGFQDGNRDEEAGTIEVGVSGPLFQGKEKPPTPVVVYQPAPAAPVPTEEGGIPWETLALLLGGAGAWKGGEYGLQKVRARRSKAG